MLYMSQPLYFSNSQPIASWALCRLDSDSGHENVLTKREKTDYIKMKSHNRKREWLSARVALKKILTDLNCIETPRDCRIQKDRFGCPSVYITKDHIRMMSCSISHKNGFASVCLGWSGGMRVGTDIEVITERPWRVHRAFVNEGDVLKGTMEPEEYFTLLWACKEAASKAIGLGMLKDFKKLQVTAERDGSFNVAASEKGMIIGTYYRFQEFFVATCYRRLGIGVSKARS
jgi:phosphopantetheinyl transferase